MIYERSMMKFFKLIVIFLTLSLAGCASLHSVSMTRIPADRKNAISAQSSSWAILGLYFSNEFVDQAVDKLRNQCMGGKVSGVFTKFSGKFYLFWTTRSVEIQGFCEKPGKGV